MEFTKLLDKNEFRNLSPTDQKSYITWKLSEAGSDDVILGNSGDGTFETQKISKSDEAELPGLISNIPQEIEENPAIPIPEKKTVAPPGGDLSQADDHSDLPPSMKGELSTVKDPEAEPVAEPETEPLEEAKPAASKPFLKASERTLYLTEEEAIRGIQAKDNLIEQNRLDLEAKERENQLQKSEIESMRLRMEASTEGAPVRINAPTETPAAKLDPIPEMPSSDDLYTLWEDHENNGPYKAISRVVEHLTHDLQPAIALANKLKSMNADAFIEQMMALRAPEMIQELWMDSAYTEVDERFPELKGQWHEQGTALHTLYQKTYDDMNSNRQKSTGESLNDVSLRGPEAAKWVMGEVLNEIQRNGTNLTATTPPSNGSQNGVDQKTTTGAPPAATSNGNSITLAEARELIKSETSMISNLAAEAARKQNEISGQTTLSAGAKDSSLGQESYTPAQMKQLAKSNPTKYRELALRDPNRNGASLNLLPRNRE